MVGILVFIHHQITIALLITLQHVRVLHKQIHRAAEQIIEIHGIGVLKTFLVQAVTVRNLFAAEIASHLLRIFLRRQQAVLCPADLAEYGFVAERLFFHIGQLHAFLHQPPAVIRIVNSKVGGIAEIFAFPPKNTRTEGVKGTCHNLLAFAAQHIGQAFLELACRFIGKGDRQNPPGRTRIHRTQRSRLGGHRTGPRGTILQQIPVLLRQGDGHFAAGVRTAVFDHIGNTVDQHGCLAASGPRQNQQSALRMEDRLLLLFIHPGELPLHNLLSQSVKGVNILHNLSSKRLVTAMGGCSCHPPIAHFVYP